ncbi:Uncharacterised protein [Legionella pneumophila]|nr:Uncharacterised protein [Legionella pneumophila]
MNINGVDFPNKIIEALHERKLVVFCWCWCINGRTSKLR